MRSSGPSRSAIVYLEELVADRGEVVGQPRKVRRVDQDRNRTGGVDRARNGEGVGVVEPRVGVRVDARNRHDPNVYPAEKVVSSDIPGTTPGSQTLCKPVSSSISPRNDM